MEVKAQARVRNSRILTAISFLGLLFCCLTSYLYTRNLNGADSAGCRIVYMGPSYARIEGFDHTHTSFASKYSLYLYREQGKDPIPGENEGFNILDGIPILFIPGNAGSYRQVRSIAAESSNLYFDDLSSYQKINPNAKNFDFFTADFNEDFTAFHGRTILDQAEYLNDAIKFILSLYENNKSPPKSVIILGHSMGGVVARVMVSLPNYIPNSINTIITLASPHAAAPLTFDSDILKIYSAVDRFWFDGFNGHGEDDISKVAGERLRDISLVSITGGLLDSVLPADYTTLGYLVPPSNGFTVYTTGMPNVWTPMDHLAIVWCCQLRRQISRTLIEISDYSSPKQTYPLDERMRIMRKNLLSGFEDYSTQDLECFNKMKSKEIRLKVDKEAVRGSSFKKTLKTFPGQQKSDGSTPTLNVFQLSKESLVFSLFSFTEIKAWKEFERDNSNVAVLLCSYSQNLDDETIVDFGSNGKAEQEILSCIDFSTDLHTIPRSFKDVHKLSDSSFGGDHEPFHAVKFNSTILSKYDIAIVAEKANTINMKEIVIAQLSAKNETEYELGENVFPLLTIGDSITLPPNRPLAVNIKIPGAWSSMLAYKLELKYAKEINSNIAELFSPFIRQWSDEPYEVKWHINLRDKKYLSLIMHGIAPFTPFKLKDQYGLNIEFWNDPQENDLPLNITLSIDFINSLRLLVLRYRLAVLAYCVSITLAVFLVQLKYYKQTTNFPTFIFGLQQICSPRILSFMCFALTMLTFIVKIPLIQNILNLVDPVVLQDSNEINLSLRKDFGLNSFFLGLEENFLWFLGPLFLVMGIAIASTCYYTLLTLGLLISNLINTLKRVIGVKNECTQKESKKQWNNRRIITTLAIAILTALYVPYQFAYVICCCIQGINSINLLTANNFNRNLFNYQFTILILMLWILPINIPTLVVFVHNLSINWKTPFSSHHNFLSILPILLLMERHTTIKSLPNLTFKYTVTKVLIGYFIFYCFLYGVRHTFWLHHLFNFLCCWLLINCYDELEQNQPGKLA